MPKGIHGKTLCSVTGCTNRVNALGLCRNHEYKKRIVEDAAFREHYRARQKQTVQTNKDRCYAAYGSYVCRCCGETEPLFLTLDHVEGNGNEHKRSIGSRGTKDLYRWIIKHDFPVDMFCVLCFNCNCGRARNGGICPHSKGL